MRYPTIPPDRGQFESRQRAPVPQQEASCEPVPDETTALVGFAAAIQRRQMTTTLLLLLASHRPLTFFTGQLLYALAPLGALAGIERMDAWAALLSAPDANQRVTALLTSSQQP